jgi:hypothetical protein
VETANRSATSGFIDVWDLLRNKRREAGKTLGDLAVMTKRRKFMPE